MDNIHQILRRSVAAGLPKSIRFFFAGLMGTGPRAGLAGKFAERRKRSADIRAEKLKILAVIDEFIKATSNCDGLLGRLRYQFQEPPLFDLAMQFRLHLQGKRQLAFDGAWEALVITSRKEVHDRLAETSDEELKTMEQILKSRLEAIRKIIAKTRTSHF